MKKLIHVLVLICLLFTVTMIVAAEDTDTVTLNLSNGNIVITPYGYQQSGSSVTFNGKYIITGERKSNTPLLIENNTENEATFDITLDNAKILADDWCTALRIDGNNPVVLNLKTIGDCLIRAHNHEAIKSGNTSSVTVKIETDPDGLLNLDRVYLSENDNILFGTDNGGTLSLEIDGVNIDANANKESYHHRHIFKAEDYTPDGNATCKADGTKSARCSANDSCFVYDTVVDIGSKKHLFETGICPFCGLHGTLLEDDAITWLKYDMDGKTTWFGIDNRNAQFEEGSYFWVKCMNPTEEQIYWDLLDDSYKKQIEKDKYILFETGVAKSDFEEYTQLSCSIPVYIQLNSDWDIADLKAAYIQDGTDENITVVAENQLDYPQGNDSFLKLTLEHFSPYIVYDELTETAHSSPKTGDVISIPFIVLFALSGVVIACITKHSSFKKYR